jgi:hypothetical protein
MEGLLAEEDTEREKDHMEGDHNVTEEQGNSQKATSDSGRVWPNGR